MTGGLALAWRRPCVTTCAEVRTSRRTGAFMGRHYISLGKGRCEAEGRDEAATRRLCRILNAQVGYADSPVGGAEEKGVVSGDGHLDANLGLVQISKDNSSDCS